MTVGMSRRHALGGLGVIVTMPWAAARAGETLMVKDNTGKVTMPLKPLRRSTTWKQRWLRSVHR